MTETELVQTIAELSQALIFLWLFLRERSRSSELANGRIADYKDWQILLLGIIDKNLPGSNKINK